MSEVLQSAIRNLIWASNQKDWSASLRPEECNALLDYIESLQEDSRVEPSSGQAASSELDTTHPRESLLESRSTGTF